MREEMWQSCRAPPQALGLGYSLPSGLSPQVSLTSKCTSLPEALRPADSSVLRSGNLEVPVLHYIPDFPVGLSSRDQLLDNKPFADFLPSPFRSHSLSSISGITSHRNYKP